MTTSTHTDHPTTFTLPIYDSEAYPTASLARIDSPLNTSSSSLMAEPPGPVQDTTATSTQNNKADDGPATRRRRRSSTKNARPRGSSGGNDGPLRFFVVDHPTKLKDKAQMRENRKHVMYDYLDKERKKPGSTDARVTGNGGAARKRKRLQPSLPGTSENPSAPSNMFGPRNISISSISTDGSRRSMSASSPPDDVAEQSRSTKPKSVPRRSIRFADDVSPLVRGISGGFNNSRYLRTSPNDLPSASSFLGSNLNPFDTWAKFSDPLLDIEQLKWSCSRKFGSQGIAQSWVPELLKAKHAFLSTVCISSSHDDIMMRGIQAPHERLPFESTDRMKVRGEVIAMINQALQDPSQQTADATIVSVLHLLNSEIMGCDDTVMMIHQRGLHDMVRSRGGLDQLGVDGQLASILTITMYMISALRECEPHSDFIRYAQQKRTKPPDDYRKLPESPVYCRMSGYYTVNRAVVQGSPTWSLLEDLRLLTNSFVRGSGSSFVSPLTPIRVNASWEQCQNSVSTLRDKIFATKPAAERPDDFSNMSEKYTFEAVRLTARVYAHALANEIPFSKAAAELGGCDTYTTTPPTYPCGLSAGSPGEYVATSWHILIKAALIRTDLSDCWNHLAGVLFWVAIVAGACANPDSPSNKPRRELSEEEEQGRKWLAAIAVRCSIVLSFEYGGSILETLKRMVGIEQVLAKADADRRGLDEVEAVIVGGVPIEDKFESERAGPAEMPFVQRTFQDFAADFLSDF